ncbi:MAG: hypothetical protein IMW85_09870 [Thermicanus sp.]|nr:hypothetical protein [Thermicanus sp.]
MRFWSLLAIGAAFVLGIALLGRGRQNRGNLWSAWLEMGRRWGNRMNLMQRMNMNQWAKRGRRIIRNMNWT